MDEFWDGYHAGIIYSKMADKAIHFEDAKFNYVLSRYKLKFLARYFKRNNFNHQQVADIVIKKCLSEIGGQNESR